MIKINVIVKTTEVQYKDMTGTFWGIQVTSAPIYDLKNICTFWKSSFYNFIDILVFKI
jgi:hypothetical protein